MLVPGPGSYSYINDQLKGAKAPGSVFPRSKRDEKSYMEVPGPGAYESLLKEHAKNAKFSMEKRNMLDINGLAPGPGAYSTTKYYEGSSLRGGSKFGNSKRNSSMLDKVPGPGVPL
jgi:hypothetical protein